VRTTLDQVIAFERGKERAGTLSTV